MKLLLTDYATLQSNNDLDISVFDRFGTVKKYKNITRTELLNEAADADIILCNKTIIDKEVFAVAKKLQYIGLFATGFNNIDIVEAKKRNIPVCNAGSYSTNAVAQQVFAYILMHYTKIPQYNDFVHGGGWERSPLFSMLEFPCDEICGKTLGIVGYGSIGKTVKKIADAFGMKTVVYTRTVNNDSKTEFVDFDTLLSLSDVVTVHCPLNEQSADMFNGSTFSKMNKGAFFINTARGGVVDEDALYEALESGQLSGAAIDVLKTEPMIKGHPLKNAKNLIITPHTSWAPLTTRQRLTKIVADNINAFLNNQTKNNVAF